MIWLTWRQFRVNAVVVAALLLAPAAALALTGPHLADVYGQSHSTFLDWIGTRSLDKSLYIVGTAAGYVVPALIGAFWGAPMVARELEAGTHRLVWSQTISRNQWLATKLGLGMLGSAAAGGVLGLAMTWWAHPVDQAVSARSSSDIGSLLELPRIMPEVFAGRGLAPLGYAAFAFSLGVLSGAVVRRTVPAMAVTLAVYVVVQVVMPNWVRPHLADPVETTVQITPKSLHGIMGRGPDGPIERLDVGSNPAGAWVVANETVDADGTALPSLGTWVTRCLPRPGTGGSPAVAEQRACFDRLAAEGYRQHVTYQPASHYWALQWRETGLLLAAAAGLVGLCFWRVRRLS